MLSRFVLYDILPAYRSTSTLRCPNITCDDRTRTNFILFLFSFFFLLCSPLFSFELVLESMHDTSLNITDTSRSIRHVLSPHARIVFPSFDFYSYQRVGSPYLTFFSVSLPRPSAHACPFLKVRSLCLRPRCVRRRINNLRLATVTSHGSHAICRPEEFARENPRRCVRPRVRTARPNDLRLMKTRTRKKAGGIEEGLPCDCV